MSTSKKGNYVKIITPELAPGKMRVFVDDMEIARVFSVEFKHRDGELPTVLVEFYPESVAIEYEAVVE